MRRFTWLAIVIVVISVLAPARPARAALELYTENFNTNTDSNGSRWEGLNNRISPENYGWSNTDVTGTAVTPPVTGVSSGAGELGGTITRAASPANFYGYNVGSVDVTQDFEASGVIRYVSGAGGFNLGYFRGASSYGSGGDAVNFVGFFFDDAKNTYATVYDANGSRNRSDSPYDLVANTTLPFRMEYRTNGFNPDTLRLTLNGNLFVMAVGVTPPPMLPFTHFGILPTSAAGSSATVYLDDLTFTRNVPEPGTLVGGVIGVTIYGLALRRRRPPSPANARSASVAGSGMASA